MTGLYQQLDSDVISPLDSYLAEPTGPSLNDFFSNTPQEVAKDLLSKYGRFWISNDGKLHYMQPNDEDTLVKHITVGNGLQGGLIVRANGIVIPTVALEQLRILLQCGETFGFNTYSNLLQKIGNHRTSLNKTIES